jgi:hypothetical protein
MIQTPSVLTLVGMLYLMKKGSGSGHLIKQLGKKHNLLFRDSLNIFRQLKSGKLRLQGLKSLNCRMQKKTCLQMAMEGMSIHL